MPMVVERERYPNASVVLVTAELRHPDAPLLGPGEQSEMKRLLASNFPLPQPLQNTGSWQHQARNPLSNKK